VNVTKIVEPTVTAFTAFLGSQGQNVFAKMVIPVQVAASLHLMVQAALIMQSTLVTTANTNPDALVVKRRVVVIFAL
jgi:hypothetical protein